MKKNNRKMLKPIKVMTPSVVLSSTLLTTSISFAEEIQPLQLSGETSENTVKSTLLANETVVSTYAELKKALELDNGITTVYLGNDLTLDNSGYAGIKINDKKANVVIDGNNRTLIAPEHGTLLNQKEGNIFTYNSNVTVKNITIKGSSLYGPVTFLGSKINLVATYENVTYSGPKLALNPNGKVIFKGNNHININNTTLPNSDSAKEAVEAASIEINGKLNVNHSNTNSVFWTKLAGTNFIVGADSNVVVNANETDNSVIYHDNGNLYIGTNATVKINTKKPLSEQPWKSFSVSSKGTFEIKDVGMNTSPVVYMQGNLGIAENASLFIYAGRTADAMKATSSVLDFNNPTSVIIQSTEHLAIWNTNNSSTIKMNSKVINTWSPELPSGRTTWKMSNGDNILSTVTVGTDSKVSSVISNHPNFTSNTFSLIGTGKRLFSLSNGTVEDLFTDLSFASINDSVNQTSIDNAQATINLLPIGAERERQQALIAKAQELLNKKLIEDAKGKTEELFKDGNFNSLQETTSQEAIDAAQDAVNKLPTGQEKNRLQELINKAQDLLNQKNQATQDLINAQNKVGDLFTNEAHNILKDTINQEAIDVARDTVNKLPNGQEKDTLQDLISKAQDLLDEKIQASQDLVNAQNKVEDLFIDDTHDILKDTIDQAAIDAAQDAVNKLPSGQEKDALQDLINKAQDLLNQKNQALELENAQNKVEDLFTDAAHNKLKDSTDQEAIDAAQNAANNLPAGQEKDTLQELINKAQELLDISNITITANPILVGQTTVYGTNSPSTKSVYIYLNNELVRVRPVSGDGTFLGHVSNTLKAGDVIRLVPADAKGRLGKAIELTVINNQVEAPTLDKYIEGDTYLTGKVAEGTAYVRIYVNGVHIRKRNVEANGVDLLAYLKDANAVAGDQIKVVPYNNKDIPGKEKVSYVQTELLKITPYLEGDEQVIGKTIKIADKIDIYVNGSLLRTRAIDKTTGEFYASMRSTINGLPKFGDVIRINARTDSGILLSQIEFTVGKATPAEMPTADNFVSTDLIIKGTVPQGATKMRIYYGKDFSQVLNRGAIDTVNLTYSIFVNDLKLTAGEQVKIVSLNANGKESNPLILTVK